MAEKTQKKSKANIPFSAFKKCRKWLLKVVFGSFFIAGIGFKILFNSKSRQEMGFSRVDNLGRWIGFLAICSFPILALGALIAIPCLLVGLVVTGIAAGINGAFNAIVDLFTSKRPIPFKSKLGKSTHTHLAATASLHKNDNNYQKSATKPPFSSPIKYLNGEHEVRGVKPSGSDEPPSLRLI